MGAPTPINPGEVMTTDHRVWDQFAIKAEVQRRGLTLTGIARAAGLYEGACRQGLIGNSRAGAEAIAHALKKPFRELFPTQYPRGRHNESDSKQNRHRRDSAKSSVLADSDRRAS